MHYKVEFEDPASHYFQVTLHCKNAPEGQTLFKMPVWAPGYYQILDAPKNVHDFTVTDTLGNPLPWRKEQKNGWLVENGTQRNLEITYTVYANDKSVAQSNVNEEKAFLSPNTVFMHIDGQLDKPYTIDIVPWHGWHTISTGLTRSTSHTAGNTLTTNNTLAPACTYTASNADVLYDAPIYIGNQLSIPFTHEGKSYELAVARPQGFDADAFIDCLKKIITQATLLMGDVPYDCYSFIIMEPGGGGLEHAHSQAVFSGSSMVFANEAERNSFLEFITHEYFHLYNVKAIRPIELGPFDYDRENYTSQLWISEGLTVYYSYLLMERAGFYTHEKVMQLLQENAQAYEPYQGQYRMSLKQASYDIWLNFFHWGGNSKETTISYYDKGTVAGYKLDSAIRAATHDARSLDHVMRLLYNRFYKEACRGFTEEEFWGVCEEVAGQPLPQVRDFVDYPAVKGNN